MYKFMNTPFWNNPDDLGGTEPVEPTEPIDPIELEPEEPTEPIELEPEEEKVPLKKFLTEKQKRKDLEKKLRELEEKTVDSDLLNIKNSIKAKYVNAKFDEDLATLISEDIAGIYADLKKSSKNVKDSSYEEEISDLAESDTLYKDAPLYKDQIKSLMKKGFTAEDAYIKLRGKALIREAKLNQEQVNAAKRKDVESKKIPVSSGGKPSNPYPLDDKDKKTLSKLQEAYPDAGWTAEKYYKTIYKE